MLALVAGLGGCQGGGAIGAGEDLFHGLQGGVIAQQRPPPPGVNDPYPNMGSIPKRPLAPDILAEQKIADQLAAQRDVAEQQAASHPLTPRLPPPPLPKPAAAPDPNANRVVVDAAATPPATPTAVQPAPVQSAPPVQSIAAKQSAAAQPGQPASAQNSAAPASEIPSLASVPGVPTAVVSGPLPSLAAAPPPGPVGLGSPATTSAVTGMSGSSAPVPGSPPSGVPSVKAPAAGAPAATTASGAAARSGAAAQVAASSGQPAKAAAASSPSLLDTLLSPTVKPRAPGDTIFVPVAVPATNSVQVSFTPGSAELPPSAPLNLRRFALAHKGVPVTITAHGEAVLPGADSQSRALDLALRRAQAIAASLATAGIPAANLHLHAEAAGQGGSASL